jgi:hypothetical protein
MPKVVITAPDIQCAFAKLRAEFEEWHYGDVCTPEIPPSADIFTFFRIPLLPDVSEQQLASLLDDVDFFTL